MVTMGYALSDGEVIKPGAFVTHLQRDEKQGVSPEDDIYRRVGVNGDDFWQAVHRPFMNRDLNRSQVKALIRRGLAGAGGSYSTLLHVLNLPPEDYQKFMDFLRHHQLKP